MSPVPVMLGGTRRYLPKATWPHYRPVAGAVYQWRARYESPWGYLSDWTAYDTFGVTGQTLIPAVVWQPLPFVVYQQPLFKWTYSSPNDLAQLGYEIWIAADAAFTHVVLDTGFISNTDGGALPVYSYQVSGLANGTYYRRIQVTDLTGAQSGTVEDEFILQSAASQTGDFALYRRHDDGSLSQLMVPVTKLTAKRRLDGPSEMTMIMDEFAPFVENSLRHCWHFDEISGATAHDIVGKRHLALKNAPTWNTTAGHFLYMATRQYGVTGNLDWWLDDDFTAYMAIRASGAGGAIFCLSSYSDSANYYQVEYNGRGYVRIKANGSTSGNLVVPTNSWIVLELLRQSGTTLYLTRLDTAASVSMTCPHPTGNTRVSVGASATYNGGNVADSLYVGTVLLYRSSMSLTQRAQNYAAFQRYLAWRGITV